MAPDDLMEKPLDGAIPPANIVGVPLLMAVWFCIFWTLLMKPEVVKEPEEAALGVAIIMVGPAADLLEVIWAAIGWNLCAVDPTAD